ncbi:hypothetical protein [Cryobacterium sp. SO1]|uniref:hypothetical protein n=1 Tax=Cryobacterium sp. SO1 TaxID=1897061 RepID=UPI0010234990|nr:hypothetical protein [Cryobacterium sp. SO1]RZI37130.1 hypothetical protein BJQ95_00474 [Cryobacterium sp. SO1]
MRTLASTILLCVVILLTGCTVAGTPSAAPTTGRTPVATTTATPTPTPSALSEPEEVAKQTTTVVSLYSQLVCTNLAERPDLDLNAAVDQLLSGYATEGLSEESRLELAHNVLEQSAAKDCPDQAQRIQDGLAGQ